MGIWTRLLTKTTPSFPKTGFILVLAWLVVDCRGVLLCLRVLDFELYPVLFFVKHVFLHAITLD